MKDERTELRERRTESMKTYENPDHSFTKEIYLSPVHYQTEDGNWEEMDDTLTEAAAEAAAQEETHAAKTLSDTWQASSGAAFLNRKGRWQASFAAYADRESAITVRNGDNTVSWHLEQAAPSEACRKDDQVLVYPEILPGIDAEYHTAGQAVKENLILKGAAQVPEGFTFVYHAEGLQAVQKGNRVLFTDETGTEVFCMSAPLMKDASGAK